MRIALALAAVALCCSSCSPAYADPTPGPGAGAYVKKAGDTMSGALKFNRPGTAGVRIDNASYPSYLQTNSSTPTLCLGGASADWLSCTGGARLRFNPNAVELSNLVGGAEIKLLGTETQITGGDMSLTAAAGSYKATGDTGANVDANDSAAISLSYATDRKAWMACNGLRCVQSGGGSHWALEQRTLTINSFHESSLCPRCTECLGTTLSAMDAQTCTDAAAAGTSTIDSVDFRTFVTAASAASVSSWTSRVAETRFNQSPHMTWKGYINSATSIRVWYGLSSAALNGSATPTAHAAAFRYDTSASDTTWKACTGDGATTSCSDTGVSVSANRLYTLEIDCRPQTACLFTVRSQSGVPVTISKSTNLPTATTNMSPRHYCEALAASARTCGLGPSALETL